MRAASRTHPRDSCRINSRIHPVPETSERAGKPAEEASEDHRIDKKKQQHLDEGRDFDHLAGPEPREHILDSRKRRRVGRRQENEKHQLHKNPHPRMDLVDLFLCQLLFGRCGLSTGPGSFEFLTFHAPPHEEAPARASAAASRMPVELNVAPRPHRHPPSVPPGSRPPPGPQPSKRRTVCPNGTGYRRP